MTRQILKPGINALPHTPADAAEPFRQAIPAQRSTAGAAPALVLL